MNASEIKELTELLVPISLFAMITLIVYFGSKFKHQTQKAIIEKGGSIDFPKKKKTSFLEIALTFVGFGLGLGVGAWFQSMGLRDEVGGMLIGASIFLFSGSGLVSAILIRRKIEKDEER